MIFNVQIPASSIPEYRYIIKTIFDTFWGLKYNILINEDLNSTTISVQDDTFQKKIILQNKLLITPRNDWLSDKSLPSKPLKTWDIHQTQVSVTAIQDSLPLLFSIDPSEPEFFRINENSIQLGLDIFGSVFFMLTRYEELVKTERDEHGRFPATASLAYQEGFLKRAIVNEYLEILWWCLKCFWPRLERKKRKPTILLSHDVDTPFYYNFMPFVNNLRICAGDIIKRKSLSLSASHFYEWCMVKNGFINKDPYNKFNDIMEISENYNIKSTFYFQSSGCDSYGVNYRLEDPLIQRMMLQIHDRGHYLGLHPSYITFLDLNKTFEEFKHLLNICENINIKQGLWGARQHYLRWQVPHTWQNYEGAGLDYDTSLGFADYAGFRCGTCYEFPVYNLLTRDELNLQERPLLAMDCSLFDKKYMALDYEESFEHVKQLIDCCKLFCGDFTLLWHNCQLVETEKAALYLKILDYFSKNN